MSYVLYTSAAVLLNCARHRELALASEGPRASQHLVHNPLVEVLDGGFEFSVLGPFLGDQGPSSQGYALPSWRTALPRGDFGRTLLLGKSRSQAKLVC